MKYHVQTWTNNVRTQSSVSSIFYLYSTEELYHETYTNFHVSTYISLTSYFNFSYLMCQSFHKCEMHSARLFSDDTFVVNASIRSWFFFFSKTSFDWSVHEHEWNAKFAIVGTYSHEFSREVSLPIRGDYQIFVTLIRTSMTTNSLTWTTYIQFMIPLYLHFRQDLRPR